MSYSYPTCPSHTGTGSIALKEKQMKSNNPSPNLSKLGSILRQLRMHKGYKSAEVFSYEHDLNRTAYWRWENGENITMKNFFKLCEIHKITPKELFDLRESRNNSTTKEKLFNDPNSVIYKKTKRKIK